VVEAVDDMERWGLLLLWPPGQIDSAGRILPCIGSAWATRHRTGTRTGRATDLDLEPTFSCAVGFGRHDKVTSTARGGDSVDDPDMWLHSTAALGSSPLHVDSGDGSLLEETPRSPTFRR
jgi:hypothetical protein